VIRLTRLNGSEMFLNADLVATVESHHDTVVTLVDGKTYVVTESAETVVAHITSYRASVLAAAERHLIGEEDLVEEPVEEVGRVLHLRPATDGGC
jgi:flagellar protein FlbD